MFRPRPKPPPSATWKYYLLLGNKWSAPCSALRFVFDYPLGDGLENFKHPNNGHSLLQPFFHYGRNELRKGNTRQGLFLGVEATRAVFVLIVRIAFHSCSLKSSGAAHLGSSRPAPFRGGGHSALKPKKSHGTWPGKCPMRKLHKSMFRPGPPRTLWNDVRFQQPFGFFPKGFLHIDCFPP